MAARRTRKPVETNEASETKPNPNVRMDGSFPELILAIASGTGDPRTRLDQIIRICGEAK